MRVAIAGLMLLAGCDRVFSLASPSRSDAQLDGDDAPSLCVGAEHSGTPGLLGVCLDAPPPDVLTLSPDVSTGVGSTDCAQIVLAGGTSGTELCLVAARTIQVTGPVAARGVRPLVLVALDDLTVDTAGTIDVSSRTARPTGAGADFAACEVAGRNGAGGTGGGGGAGGSFAVLGGAGGNGGTGAQAGGSAGPPAVLDAVRGGCRGGRGGDHGTAGTGGRAGSSGGAVYVIAGRSITVAGTISASGEPGSGGMGISSGRGAGGGGGGSGGLIGLDAPSIVLEATAKLLANGGGGGGGGGVATGSPGTPIDPVNGSYAWPSQGGAGGMTGGVRGGDGGNTFVPVGAPGTDAAGNGGGGGGGGGGGVGVIRIYSATPFTDEGASSSPAPNT